jgi:hypothetical protein
VEDRQPLLTPEDCLLAEEIVKADSEIVELLKNQYGITDLSLVACDPWSGANPCPLYLPRLPDSFYLCTLGARVAGLVALQRHSMP